MSHHDSHNHEHDHGHGDDHGDDHGHEHSDETEPALQTLIWKQIDFESIRTLNESETDSGAKIVEKTWPQRLNPEPELVSDADEQLLMFVPWDSLSTGRSRITANPSSFASFAGALKLHSILIRSSDSPSAPRTLKLFINNDALDFASATDLSPTQTLTLSRTNDIQELPVKRALFGNTYNLNLYVEDNYGDDVTRVWWLGFKGEIKNLTREPVEVLYEKAANPKDHTLVQGIGDMSSSGLRHGI